MEDGQFTIAGYDRQDGFDCGFLWRKSALWDLRALNGSRSTLWPHGRYSGQGDAHVG